MFLALTDDERQIAEATADAIAAEAPLDRWFLPQTDPLADGRRLHAFGVALGWTGFAAPAAVGGAEASLVDEMLVFREIGAKLAPVAFAAAAIGVQVALAAGNEALARRIVAGDAKVGLVAGRDGMVLLGADGAELALAWCRDCASLKAVAAQPDRRVGLDGMTIVGAMPPQAETIASASDGDLVLRFRLIVAAQLQGIAETALAESNAYAKLREQFGRPIGSFQAVRHRIADMEIRARRALALVHFAAVRLRDGGADADFQVNAALVLAIAAARVNAEDNIANHGAIGVTTENIGHLLLKRAMLWAFAAGPEAALLDAVGGADAPTL